VFPVTEGDVLIEFFVDLTNDGDYEGEVELRLNECCFQTATSQRCERDLFLPRVQSHLVEPFATERYLLEASLAALPSLQGSCAVDVVQAGVVEFSEDIPFHFEVIPLLSPPSPSPSPPPGNRLLCFLLL
jgi:hypothetical protein